MAQPEFKPRLLWLQSPLSLYEGMLPLHKNLTSNFSISSSNISSLFAQVLTNPLNHVQSLSFVSIEVWVSFLWFSLSVSIPLLEHISLHVCSYYQRVSPSVYSTTSPVSILCFMFGLPQVYNRCSMNILWEDNTVDEKVSQTWERTGIRVRTSGFSLMHHVISSKVYLHLEVSIFMFLKIGKLIRMIIMIIFSL